MILINRKPAARRNWLIFSVLLLGTSASCLTTRPLDSSVATSILFGFAILFAVMNSFRLPWIVYLTKREKLFSLASGFFLFAGFTAIAVQVGGNTLLRQVAPVLLAPALPVRTARGDLRGALRGDGVREHPLPPAHGGGVRQEALRGVVPPYAVASL